MENDPKKRRKRNTSQKRNSLIQAAIKIFCDQGYYDASMDRIAEAADASKRTLYNHFPSKEELLKAVVLDYLDIQKPLKEIQFDPKKKLQDQLKAFIQAELYFVNTPERKGLAKVLTSVFLKEPELAMKIRAGYTPPRAMMGAWLMEAKNNGSLHMENPELAARVFYGLVEGCLTWPALFGAPTDEESIQFLIDEIVEVFLLRYA
jgi:TetR/AcrR family transcriptional regulator of autoinduction and epiphytic fitness